MEDRVDYALDRDATGFVSTNHAPPAEIRLDDLAFIIEAGLKAAWDVTWPGWTEEDGGLSEMSDYLEGLLMEIAIAKRRVKVGRRILAAIFPDNERWQDEFWIDIPYTEEIVPPKCCSCTAQEAPKD